VSHREQDFDGFDCSWNTRGAQCETPHAFGAIDGTLNSNREFERKRRKRPVIAASPGYLRYNAYGRVICCNARARGLHRKGFSGPSAVLRPSNTAAIALDREKAVVVVARRYALNGTRANTSIGRGRKRVESIRPRRSRRELLGVRIDGWGACRDLSRTRAAWRFTRSPGY